MVSRARAKAVAADVAVDVRVGDANAPDLDPAAYDVVLSRHVLWPMDDPAAALERWLAPLAPGGVLVLVEGSWSTGAGITAEEAVAPSRHRPRGRAAAAARGGSLGQGDLRRPHLLSSR